MHIQCRGQIIAFCITGISNYNLKIHVLCISPTKWNHTHTKKRAFILKALTGRRAGKPVWLRTQIQQISLLSATLQRQKGRVWRHLTAFGDCYDISQVQWSLFLQLSLMSLWYLTPYFTSGRWNCADEIEQRLKSRGASTFFFFFFFPCNKPFY